MRAQPNLWFIDDIFEIRLLEADWQRVKQTAMQREISYSWVVRICIFAMISKHRKKIDYQFTQKSLALKQEYKFQRGKSFHRHLLCLYGDDAHCIRLEASRLGITVSHFIRLALREFLDKIDVMSTYDLVMKGVKINRKIDTTQAVFGMELQIKKVIILPFERESYSDFKPFKPWHYG